MKSIKIVSFIAEGQLETVSWLWSKYLSVRVRKVSAAFILNATDPIALSSLPMGDIDCAIVSIGQCIEHSLRIVAILKNMKVQKLYVRAIDEMHAMILKAMGIDKILYPEEFAGRYLAENLMKGVDVEVK